MLKEDSQNNIMLTVITTATTTTYSFNTTSEAWEGWCDHMKVKRLLPIDPQFKLNMSKKQVRQIQ